MPNEAKELQAMIERMSKVTKAAKKLKKPK